MASSSNSSQQEAVMRKQNNGPPYKFLVPLIYAPVLPLICLPLTQFAPSCFVPFLFIGRKKKKTEVIVICIVVGVVDWIM
ncbi:uncharacterized protein LOC107176731 isoform X4 [Citrus sinensis]|uniref:uncharacterized protein LOC107176731 isoform X4 n=1 Tax=Citrus sinensis TaxID=2711 RepID=UPI0007639FA1|nr:uncharacterized protein LOC107176731 isoform X4 [Citrus sinensis]